MMAMELVRALQPGDTVFRYNRSWGWVTEYEICEVLRADTVYSRYPDEEIDNLVQIFYELIAKGDTESFLVSDLSMAEEYYRSRADIPVGQSRYERSLAKLTDDEDKEDEELEEEELEEL